MGSPHSQRGSGETDPSPVNLLPWFCWATASQALPTLWVLLLVPTAIFFRFLLHPSVHPTAPFLSSGWDRLRREAGGRIKSPASLVVLFFGLATGHLTYLRQFRICSESFFPLGIVDLPSSWPQPVQGLGPHRSLKPSKEFGQDQGCLLQVLVALDEISLFPCWDLSLLSLGCGEFYKCIKL